ncbi:MAG: hypothetical protein CME65_16140 [Halobacteriovoraceae bacterium]|nr:hypothetical protein [Halobacteriovoraceae bacterium]|tara:strand:+ start:13414 stop:13764 length:351 start_codon:yes stop_codon:yes gene_type:complete
MHTFIFKSKHFCRLIGRLVISVPFITLSFFGNFFVFLSATLVYYLENGQNPKIQSFIDALWWSFSTTTTVGYGDITPITFEGKLVGIISMLIGVAIFGIYTALFARAIIDDDVYMN